MLIEIDRLQLAVADAEQVVQRWQSILGAELESVDTVAYLGATRSRLRIGTGYVEILQPNGEGLVADALAKRGPHLFSAGASTLDVAGVQAHLASITNNTVLEAGQLYVDGNDIGIPGLRIVISQHETLPAIGLLDYLYEATLLAADAQQQTAKFAEVFCLDAQEFVNIDSPKFGYNGTLTLFKKNQLHRFEVITPSDADNTMGRFFNKTGPCLYMGFAETANILEIEKRAKAQGLGHTVDRPADRAEQVMADQVWLHPVSLGGMMLGLSRPSMAWSWSGSPDKVETIA